MIYLDNAATSYPKPEYVYEAVLKCMKEYGANPGRSGHRMAIEAGKKVYRCRELLAELFNIPDPMDIVFTYNATDAINLAVKGFIRSGDHIITTSMEHNAVARPLTTLKTQGVDVSFVPCGSDGTLNAEDIEGYIRPNTRLIAMTHASNVTGTILPINEVGEVAHEHGITFLVDAAQTAGTCDIDAAEMNIDMLAFPGHKGLLGPQGTGGLYIKKGVELQPLKQGGTGSNSESLIQPDLMPDKFESGTLNTPGIAGLAAGVEYILDKGVNAIHAHEIGLIKQMLEELRSLNGVSIYGPSDAKGRVGIISLNIDGITDGELSNVLDQSYDIATRAGLHCAPLAHTTIGTIDKGAVRFSVSYFNTRDDIDAAVSALKDIVHIKA
ncbi:aminotransferase class V-fold PLP-dependent enzyme [Mahella australiensis]|uniref:aminotransferase class V-fold PLP-dependent enzyme n=1 Tax=Mahella australiensis TaxID=252966 RepID=UPI00031F5026|nr:aminotransferase class V-fold PLP-dependent enzyme [Mahella australiensis]